MSEQRAGIEGVRLDPGGWPAAASEMEPAVGSAADEVLVGVVHSGGTVCHVSVARTPDRLARDLAAYVRENARYQLSPGDAQRVRDLIGRGLSRQALDHYFRIAEQRWGEESLVVRRVGLARGDHG